jgi:hypothetical protein
MMGSMEVTQIVETRRMVGTLSHDGEHGGDANVETRRLVGTLSHDGEGDEFLPRRLRC